MKNPSVFVVTLPKSGTDFTNNSLLRATGLKLPGVYLDAGLMAAIWLAYRM